PGLLHHSWVRVHHRERLAIACAPRTEHEALRSQGDGRRHPSELAVHVIVSPMTASASGSLCISWRRPGYTRRVTFARRSSDALDETGTIGSSAPCSTYVGIGRAPVRARRDWTRACSRKSSMPRRVVVRCTLSGSER